MAIWRPENLASIAGIAARRALRLYVVMAGLVMAVLLLTAWAIDLGRNFDDVAAKARDTGSSLSAVLLPYLLYRTVDIVTRLFPVACFLALFLAELLRRNSRETVILHSVGLSPLQSMAPIVAFALMAGTLQTALEAYWRPAAVFAQVDLGVGQYARRFKRGLLEGHRWVVVGDLAIRALVVADEPPELREMEIYNVHGERRLDEFMVGAKALPVGDDGLWRIQGAVVCSQRARPPCGAPTDMIMELGLRPAQLTYLNVPSFNVPNAALRVLADIRSAPNFAEVQLAVWRRWTAWLLPGSFALLGASLAQIVWSGRVQSAGRILAVCFLGYLMIVSVKFMWALGEVGATPAFAAALLSILTALMISVAIQWRRSHAQ